jgi:hypothetical protein
MTAFEHVTALFSFVYALALTHLLAHIGQLVVARDRVKFSGLLGVAMANAILNVFLNWLSLWDLRTVQTWDLITITIQFVFAIVVFLVCVFVAPKVPDDGDVDLEDFYWHQRISIYTAILAMAFLALIANFAFLKSANAALFVKENLVVLTMLVPIILALASRARWAQWFAGLAFLVQNLVYAVLFCRSLS